MIHTLRINGFKTLSQDTAIPLGRVNCFIGANGVGKSNILEALGVISAAANGVINDESLLRRGVRAGLPRLYKSSFANQRTPAHIGIGVESAQDAAYRVSLLNPLDAPEPAWTYKTEVLSTAQTEIISKGVRNQKHLNPQAGLAALKMVELLPEDPAAQLLHALQHYAIYTPNTPALRSIVPDQQSRRPLGLNGGQLAEGFDLLRKHLSEQGELGEEHLAQVLDLIDWVSDINMTAQVGALLSPEVPRTKYALKFTDRFMNKSRNELTAYDASEGALYILFTAILCLLPQSPAIFAIDNLDQALNPRLLARLVQRLSGWLAAHDTPKQLLFTAHNPAVLDGLDLSNPDIRLFAVERDNHGLTEIRRIELTPELQQLNQTYPLSRLWLMGHLGAVPNV
jgi:energy-coupling factor transporter ATP-binding protein EcfA2